MGRLRMLLSAVELVQAMHRHESDEGEVPQLADEVPDGASGVRAGDVAPCDGQKVLRFYPGDVTDVRAADRSESRCRSEPYVVSGEPKPPLFRVNSARSPTSGADDEAGRFIGLSQFSSG